MQKYSVSKFLLHDTIRLRSIILSVHYPVITLLYSISDL